MNLSKFAVKRPVTITMLILIVILFGAISLGKLPIDLYPEIEIPIAIVSTSYSGAGPQEIESLITKNIESAVATVGNIDKITSISSEGNSVVIAQFNFGTNMDFASLEMREKVDLVKGGLPKDATAPMVMRIDPNATPIIQLAMSSTSGDLVGLQSLAEDTIKQRFERLDGVASVNVGGGMTKEIEIIVSPWKLNSYGLSIDQVSQVLQASNMNLPGGVINNGTEELSMRVVGEFDGIDDIKNLPIILNSGSVIYLEDVAEVKYVTEDRKEISRVNQKDSVSMSLQKQSGKNTVKVAEEIRKEIDKIKEEYPEVDFNIVMDSSEFISSSINNVKSNVIVGSIFAILILYIFLKSVKTTMVVGLSIPISLIASFILLYLSKITINMMTLGGLALAVGMLVDSAIVVLENIYRLRMEGYSSEDASIIGAKEVGMSITASTLTTIAVFLPIVFVDGMVGIMFKDFALTVTLSLVASLVVALTLIPMLTSKMLKNMDTGGKKKLDFIYKIFDGIIEKTEKIYEKLLDFGLRRRKTVIFVSIVVFVFSTASLALVGMEFFPSTDEGNVNISVSLPIGSKIHDVDEIVTQIEEGASTIDDIETMFTDIGGGGMMGGSSTNTGSISINLKKDRTLSTSEVSRILSDQVKDIPGAEINVSNPSSGSGMGGSPISIAIKGDDLGELDRISKDFKKILEEIPGTKNVQGGLDDGVPELEIVINKKMATSYGLTTAQIASSVRTASMGSTATRLRNDGEEIDVILKGTEDYKDSLNNLKSLEVATPVGVSVPLGQLADFNIEKGPVNINREDQVRVFNVTSDVDGTDLGSVMKEFNEKLDGYTMPDGYTYSMGGENKEMMEAFGSLLQALLVAVILIYMVMAAQFESLIHPFIIMFTIPLAFGGGFFGLFLTGTPFGVTAFIGIIMLSGIVVNNGIVLIDYVNQLRKEGHSVVEAIKIAGPTRLRPILMTTLTTVLGLVPLALGIGDGAEIQAPMAIVVISGLTIATILTLVFVPVLYSIFEDIASKFKKKKEYKDELANE